MAGISAEKLAQRAFDCDLVGAHELEAIWGEFGSRDVDLADFTALLVRKEILTNFQVERLLAGKRDGYFYGQYKVLYMVGSGTFARVYRAVHRETGKVVAVKVLRQRYADDMVTTEQFIREAEMVKPLRHPNIVPVFEVDRWRGRAFMVMDFVEGQNLRDFIKVRKSLPLLDCLRLIADVMNGLEYALSKGVSHRDLKLSNVLVSSQGRARLVDFGLAAISAYWTDNEKEIKSAPNPRSIDYAGLERATGVRRNDPRSDLYFAGCMLYHMVAGKAPLHETRDRLQRLSVTRYREVTPLGERVPDLPNYFLALVNKAMDLKPDRRYQTPTEMLADVRTVAKRVEAGDTGEAPIPNEAPEPQDETRTETSAPIQQEGNSRRILVVESNVEMQNALRKSLKRHGYRVLVFSDPDRALQRCHDHLDEGPLADCFVFSAQELGETAVEAFNRFGEDQITRATPAILLVDPQLARQARDASRGEHRVLLPLPIKLKHLRTMLFRLLQAEPVQD